MSVTRNLTAYEEFFLEIRMYTSGISCIADQLKGSYGV